MLENNESDHWMLVAHELRHLVKLQEGERSWWCTTSKCQAGDKAFIYKPGVGIMLYLQLGRKMTDQKYCQEFGMQTVSIEVIKILEPPLSVKTMRKSEIINQEAFLRRQFQGSIFKVASKETPNQILKLASEPSD